MEKELLYRFFEGKASVEEEKEVLDWLDNEPDNRVRLIAERRVFDAMLLHARATGRSKTFRLPGWTREVLKYAAVVLVAAGFTGLYVSYTYNRIMQGGNTISVPAGQRVDLTLPDGTKVCMNALSELKYPTFFTGKNRKVELDGEAFFEVAHDAKHPFVVETYACDVEVLGTRFDVEARAESGEFVVSLVEGRVRVTDRKNPATGVDLCPNELVRHMDGRMVVGKIEQGEEFLWREGLISFRDASFMELIDEFEKYFDVQIEVLRKQVPENRFTGKIRIAEGVDHALRVLQRSVDFSYRRNDTREIIYIR